MTYTIRIDAAEAAMLATLLERHEDRMGAAVDLEADINDERSATIMADLINEQIIANALRTRIESTVEGN